MSYSQIMVHSVWSTKNREPIISNEIKDDLLNHIKENSFKKGIFIDSMNCTRDHIHILLSLGNDQTISNIIQLIKGESSHWINTSHIGVSKFEWQNDYFAMSVSHSMIEKVRSYIKNQEEHHKKKSFSEECEEIFIKYGLSNSKENFG